MGILFEISSNWMQYPDAQFIRFLMLKFLIKFAYNTKVGLLYYKIKAAL